MRARARLAVAADATGTTRLTVLRGESPLLPRRTGRSERGVTVHLVGGAAGPLRGDDLRLDIEVGPGADLTVRGVAASLALPGRPGEPASRLAVHASVAAGGTLRWLPEPLIAAAGCHHHAIADVTVADGGSLVWRDDLVCGRHGEQCGDVTQKTTIRYAGLPLYRNDLTLGPSAPGWDGPAVLGDGRATGSLILAGPELPAPGPLGPGAVLMSLAGPGMLATAVGADIRAVRAALDPLSTVPTGQAATAIGTP